MSGEDMRYGRRIASVAAAMVILGVMAVSAPVANAANGNVWINFGTWNCPSGGSVVGVYWAVDNVSSGPPGGDWGDNVIYPTVRIGAWSTISYQLYCKKWGWYQYRGVVSQRDLRPYAAGLSYTY
jgi:hypothetical protein